ncbi:hypothetical protein DOTSEDRAFT_21857 [Dothistroma septosporum NZE10]|uniref:Chromo domain-containing protein n=1 Tax=Dothistroma septosporum (strain NZE10 / CBS 128990) TaxID=675120 RepID=N1Q120_DOTSN|nr:hypothetical protein DOTSEDRAFT_21857 [Dothistroma septosporum NZE10]
MFHEDSDNDSIRTDSTAPSEPRDDYPVERILCEQWNAEDECPEYLIKWEGYPLERANYEPASNFVGDAILPEWEDRKVRIEQGLERPFDEDDWYQAVEIAEAEKDARHARRKAKRRKRGITVSPDETDNNDGGNDESSEEDVPLAHRRSSHETPLLSPAKKRVRQPEIQRKGVVQIITKRRRAPSSASSSSKSDSSSQDSRDSMLEELKDFAPTRKSTSSASAPMQTKAREAPLEDNSTSKKTPTVGKSTESPDRTVTPNTQTRTKLPTEGKRKPEMSSKAVVSSAARKSAPSTGATAAINAKATAKDLFSNWTADKKPRQRPRVSGKTPKDSGGPKFTTLSMQRRFQLYSRNEKAPDVGALTMLDTKTGKPLASQRDTASGGSTAPQQAPPSPPAPIPVLANDLRRDNDLDVAPIRQSSANISRVSINDTTCAYWLRGHCRFSAAECKFAHYDTGIHAGQPGSYGKVSATCASPTESLLQKTCWWWRQPQGCTKSDAECQFAHHDTGIYAPRPGAFREGSTAGVQQSGPPPTVYFAPQPPPAIPPPGTVSPKETTCWWWLQPGGCNKPDDKCAFAHWDTGIHAGRPGSFRKAFEAKEQPSKPDMIPPPPPPPPMIQSPIVQLARVPGMVHIAANVTLLLCLRGTDEPLKLSAKLEVQDLPEVERLIGRDATLRATRVVTAGDFENIVSNELGGSRTSFGGVHFSSSQRSEAEAVTEMLNRHDSALVAAVPGRDVYAVIWPRRADRWKFLDDGEVALSDESVLHFRMFPRLTGFKEAESVEASAYRSLEQQHHAVRLGEVMAGLDSEKLLPTEDGNKPADRAVFLMFPQTHAIETQVCAEYFQGAGLKVYHSETLGAWDYFRRTHHNACSIVLHPDVPIWEIPGLYNILSMTAAKFYTLGTNRIVAELEDREPTYECNRMFPHGNVAFITDNVFVHRPEKATDVIKAFLEANRHKPEGGENNRIATRPGVKAWLLNLAMEKTAERGRQDERWMQLYDVICRFCPPEDEDPLDPEGNPSPTSNLISIPREHLPSFDRLWEKDETASTDYMVNWFAGWAVLNASKYRRFIVCSEPRESRIQTTKDKDGKMISQVEADPRGWAKKYQHVGVALPGKVAGMLNSKWKR